VLLDQHVDARVIVPDDGGLRSVPVTALLPYTFPHPDAAPPRLLRFNARHWESVTAGTKTATTRFGEEVPPGPVTMLFEFDDRYRSLPGEVESVEKVRFADISDAQAALEGCSADELRVALRTYHYPEITDDDAVSFVRFTAVPA
jgi:cytidine deaminase